MIGIYIIKNINNGRFYIGKSTNSNRRWYMHKWHLNKGSHSNKFLQRDFDKCGLDAFAFKILMELPDAEACSYWEQKLLNRFVGRDDCYNISPLSVGGSTLEYNGMKGKKHSADTIEKMVKSARRGDDNPTKRPEVRAKMSKAARSRKMKTCPHCGKHGTTNMKRYHFDNCKNRFGNRFDARELDRSAAQTFAAAAAQGQI